MTEVRVRHNESIDSAIKRFERICKKDGIQDEIRRRRFYQKPSDRRKRKR